MKKLPIGIQTFSEIINNDYLYIDKTREAYELVSNYKYAFLSRPRRFGKSLFMDTLQDIFEGNKSYFEGLYIYDKWDWEKSYPVIKIDWNSKLRTIDDLEQKLKITLQHNQERLDIKCSTDISLHFCFEELIVKAYEKYNMPVVVLIDEYDKPILDVVDDIEKAKEHREYIKGLYSILKGCDRYLKFVFLTGVSKFSKSSIFSGLNMLEDISLTPKFGNVCGYTQDDIETTFLPYLKGVDLKRFRDFYNGYNFLKNSIYNPFDTLLFIKNEFVYKNYWFATGTPTFLIKLMKKHKYFLPKLANLVVDEKLLDSFDIENIDLEVILYQAGYLTIDSVKEKRRGGLEYKLKIPNVEVKQSLNDFIIDYLTNQKTEKISFQDDMYDALYDGDLESFKTSLISVFASIPYNNYTKNDIQHYEGFYSSIIYVYLQSLGLDIVGEDVTNKGRIDLTVFLNNKIYIIEFKVGTENAIEQIKKKNYAQKYISQDKEIFLVGINFDEDEKNISEFRWILNKKRI